MFCSFRDLMTSKTLALIPQLKIVELFGPVLFFEATGSKAEGGISYNY